MKNNVKKDELLITGKDELEGIYSIPKKKGDEDKSGKAKKAKRRI